MSGSIRSFSEITGENHRCEYLVIGSGAGGSVAAKKLSEAGKEVLLIEEGSVFKSEDFTSGIGKLTRTLYRRGGVTPFWGKPVIGFAEGVGLGGTTLINGGLLWRTPSHILEDWNKRWREDGFDEKSLLSHFKEIEEMLNVTPSLKFSGNQDSILLEEASKRLNWKYTPAPRALIDCKNTNRCGTGCPTGAKQSMALTYLPRAVALGATVWTDARATRIRSKSDSNVEISLKGVGNGRKTKVTANHVFVASGALQTPLLLRRSGLSRNAGKQLRFHLNFKCVALFKEPIHAQNGTIFTGQVQEFEEEGVLMMASNLQPHYVATTLAHYSPDVLKEVLSAYDYAGLFVAQIKAESVGRVLSMPGSDPLVVYSLNEKDIPQVKKAYLHLAQLLFEAGAIKIYPPIRGARPARNLKEVENQLTDLDIGKVELLSVHAMSSCAMGLDRENAVIDWQGRVVGYKNITVCDASVLPTNLGESPQGTIMAFSHEIVKRHLSER